MTDQLAISPLTPAKLLAVNVNGLADGAKRKDFFQSAFESRWDVMVLSETHCGSREVATNGCGTGLAPASHG